MSKAIGKYVFILFVLLLTTKCVSLKKNSIDVPIIVSNPCEYFFQDVSDVRLDNILFNDKNTVSLALLPKVNSLLSNVSDTTLLEYAVNLKLQNTTSDTLFLKRFNYSVYVDKKIMDQGIVEDSLVILPNRSTEYSLLMQTKISDYASVFQDPQESTNTLKGFLGLNNQVVKSSLEIDSVFYTINGQECVDGDKKKIKF